MEKIDPTAAFAPNAPKSPVAGPFARDTRNVKVDEGKYRTVPSRLTRKAMEDIIRSGQSVVIDGIPTTDLSQLPSEAKIASDSGDTSEIERVRQEKQAQIDELKKQVEELSRSTKQSVSPPIDPLTPTADPKDPKSGGKAK